MIEVSLEEHASVGSLSVGGLDDGLNLVLEVLEGNHVEEGHKELGLLQGKVVGASLNGLLGLSDEATELGAGLLPDEHILGNCESGLDVNEENGVLSSFLIKS